MSQSLLILSGVNLAINLEEVIASNMLGLGRRSGMMISRGAVITSAATNGVRWSERPYFCKSPLPTRSSHLPPPPAPATAAAIRTQM